jgi:hypothetical protein
MTHKGHILKINIFTEIFEYSSSIKATSCRYRREQSLIGFDLFLIYGIYL